jgi:hypothetical protein
VFITAPVSESGVPQRVTTWDAAGGVSAATVQRRSVVSGFFALVQGSRFAGAMAR